MTGRIVPPPNSRYRLVVREGRDARSRLSPDLSVRLDCPGPAAAPTRIPVGGPPTVTRAAPQFPSSMSQANARRGHTAARSSGKTDSSFWCSEFADLTHAGMKVSPMQAKPRSTFTPRLSSPTRAPTPPMRSDALILLAALVSLLLIGGPLRGRKRRQHRKQSRPRHRSGRVIPGLPDLERGGRESARTRGSTRPGID